MQTIGIDLAVRPSNTGTALIEWSETGGEIDFLTSRTNDGLLDVLTGDRYDCAGIDVPLGWPMEFAAVVQEHAALRSLRISEDWDQDYSGFRLRETDRWVRDELAGLQITRPPNPISVSADKLGAPAMRAAWLLDRYAQNGSPRGEIDRSGQSGPVIEVYPAAALAVWGLRFSGYKSGKDARGAQLEIWEGMKEAARLQGSEPANDHELDAAVSAVVARMAQLSRDTNQARLSHACGDERVKSEGAIHLPLPRSLERLYQ